MGGLSGGDDAARTDRYDESYVAAAVIGKWGRQYMGINQQVAIENAVMRIVCGDSRSYGGQK